MLLLVGQVPVEIDSSELMLRKVFALLFIAVSVYYFFGNHEEVNNKPVSRTQQKK